MTSSNSWHCDGLPKNGQQYSDLGGYHNSHLNYSLNCEICGLPKEAQYPSKKKESREGLSLLLPIFARLALAGIVALASGVTVYTFLDRVCEAGLEKIDGECSDPFLQTYEDATKKGDDAIELADNYQTLEDLETAKSNLTNVITDLSQIPLDASVYSDVEPKLEEYQTKKTQISSNLKQETAAEEQLKEIVMMVQTAKEQTETAATTAELAAAKQKWQEVNSKLQAIESTTLIDSKVSQYQSEYERQITSINEQIATLAQQNRPRPTPTTTSIQPEQPKKRSPTTAPTPQTKPQAIPLDPCAVDNPPPNCRF